MRKLKDGLNVWSRNGKKRKRGIMSNVRRGAEGSRKKRIQKERREQKPK